MTVVATTSEDERRFITDLLGRRGRSGPPAVRWDGGGRGGEGEDGVADGAGRAAVPACAAGRNPASAGPAPARARRLRRARDGEADTGNPIGNVGAGVDADHDLAVAGQRGALAVGGRGDANGRG